MRYLLSIALVCLLLTSCYINKTTATHDYNYYGTDALRTESDFFYIKQSATGTSKIAYKYRNGSLISGGDVRLGAVADAKADLAQKFPLQKNQAYTNVSIDITRTERAKHAKGFGTMISPIGITQAVSFNVVVSADIIEYGISLLDKDFSNNNSGSINTLSTKKLGELQLYEGQEVKFTLSTKKLGELQLYEGQELKFKNFDNTIIEAIVVDYTPSNKSYQLKYLDKESTYQIKNVLQGSYRRIILN
jgi:hypothetical protein